MYDYIIFTHIPAFYKVNLYNEMSKKIKIHVVFISEGTDEKRGDDFLTLHKANFTYQVLCKGNFQRRNIFSSIYEIYKILNGKKYQKILISGWDLIEFWYISLFFKKENNCLALESTVFESKTNGIKGLMKRVFLSRIGQVFASGNLHVLLLSEFKYKGAIRITRGVGIINKQEFIKKDRRFENKFLYIGRLVAEKNLEMLIDVFNALPDKKLTIVGDGEQKEKLESIANENITFLSPIKNGDISNVFLDHNVFILPSISETWGIVVEEAFHFGVPVIVSKNCGSCELIEDQVNGFIIDPFDKEKILNVIKKIDNNIYENLSLNLLESNFDLKDKLQVQVYIDV